MTETVVQNWTYQAVMHPRNRRLHDLIDIAGEAWNYCIAYERWACRWFGVYVHNFDLQRHVAALRRDMAAYEHVILLAQRVSQLPMEIGPAVGDMPVMESGLRCIAEGCSPHACG